MPKVMLPVKVTPDERTRIKVACAKAGLSYGGLILALLDDQDARLERAARRQAHPLHRPAEPVSM